MEGTSRTTEILTGSRLRRAGIYACRLILAAGVVAIGAWSLAGLSALGERVNPLAKPVAPTRESEPTAHWLTPADLQGGGWMIAGLPWRILTKELTPRGVETALLAAPAGKRMPTTPNEQSKLILDLAKALAPERRPLGEYFVYDVKLPGARFVLFTTGSAADEQLAFGRIAFNKAGAPSVLIEASPAEGGENSGAVVGPGLLPYPVGYKRLATRTGEKGALIADTVSVPADANTLRELWQQYGYRTEPLPGKSGEMQGFTCVKDGRAIQAWLWPSPENRSQTLVMAIALKVR